MDVHPKSASVGGNISGHGGPPPPTLTTASAGPSDPNDPTPRALIYKKARDSGLNHAEAQSVVREMGLVLAKSVAEGNFKPALGFEMEWLLKITQWKITDALRRKSRTSKRRHESNSENP